MVQNIKIMTICSTFSTCIAVVITVNQMHRSAFLKVVLVQIAYLEQWPTIERENSISLLGATEALKASTLRLPVTSGAKVC
jgi:hypothetical protein